VPDEITKSLPEALREPRQLALEAFDLVIGQLDRVLEAIRYQDVELAGMVVAGDDAVDARYLEVQNDILALLGSQPAVAAELRLVAALLQIIRCVERVGDQCVNIAKLVPLSGHEQPKDKDIVDALGRMGKLARSQVEQAKHAFDALDLALARDLVRQDAEINRLNRSVFKRAVEIGGNIDLREWAMLMILAARALERIGDNSVDVAEQVAFVVTGLFEELTDASRPARRPSER
jgi:phosphate transport system protein